MIRLRRRLINASNITASNHAMRGALLPGHEPVARRHGSAPGTWSMAQRRALRWLRWFGLAGVGVVGLLAAAALSSPLWLRPLVERQASAALGGRPVTIGRLHITPGNPLVITAEDVVIGSPPGFPGGEEPFARVPRLALHLDALASLRRREVVLPAVEIERPAVRAVATEDGRDNYGSDLLAAPRGGAAGPRLGALTILDGRARVSLVTPRTDLEVVFATEPGAEAQGGGAPGVVAEARGTYAGEPVAARFAGGPLLDPLHDASRPWPVELHAEHGATRASAKGALRNPLTLQGAALGLLLAGPDMALLAPLTGVPFPATPPYELGGRLDHADGVFRVTDAAGRVGRSDVAGAMTVALRPGRRPEIAAEVRSRAADLRDVAALLRGGPGPAGTPGQTPEQRTRATREAVEARASPRVLPQAPLNPPKLERADVRLDWRAERVLLRSTPFDDLALGMEVVDGAVALRPLSFGVGRGRVSGEVSLSPQAEGAVRARADVRFERLDLGRLVGAATGGDHQGAGALNGTARLEGTGRSVAEILGSADGAAALWMAGGELSKLLVDLAGLRLGSALLSALGGPPRARVECFVADLALRRGVLSVRALLLETEDAVTEGEGAVDLGRERVAVRLRTESKRLTVGVLPAPLLVSGTLKDPRAAPDPAAPAARGGIAGALAALPTIQLGIGDDPRCDGLLRRIRRAGPATGPESGGGAGASGGGGGGRRRP
jgi:AsmA family protein